MEMVIPKHEWEDEVKIERQPAHQAEASDILLAKDLSETLLRHYPGYPWAVFVDSEGGVVHIRNWAISWRYGYLLHYKDVAADPQRRLVINAGGEMLERSYHRRGPWDHKYTLHIDGVEEKYQPIFQDKDKGLLIL